MSCIKYRKVISYKLKIIISLMEIDEDLQISHNGIYIGTPM